LLKDKEFKNEAQLEQFRSVMQMSTMAIKNAILINGAAAISLLTFLGNEKFDSSISYLVYSLQLFCLGVTLAAFATAFGYFAQSSHLTTIQNNEQKGHGKNFGFIAAGLILLSYTTFAAGCILASLSFTQDLTAALT
jgi:hypothetical protein